MREIRTSGLMSGEGKPPAASRSRSSALPRLYFLIGGTGLPNGCRLGSSSTLQLHGYEGDGPSHSLAINGVREHQFCDVAVASTSCTYRSRSVRGSVENSGPWPAQTPLPKTCGNLRVTALRFGYLSAEDFIPLPRSLCTTCDAYLGQISEGRRKRSGIPVFGCVQSRLKIKGVSSPILVFGKHMISVHPIGRQF